MLNRFLVTGLVLSIITLPLYAAADTKPSAKDGKIVGMLIALDNNEIAAAKKALDVTTNSSVKDFANKMISDHQQNLAETQKIGEELNVKDTSNNHAEAITKQGDNEMKKLSDLSGEKFDKAYMDSQVKDHVNALKMVKKMISEASNADLKNHLEKTKDAISHHLEDAKETDADLKKST